MFTRDARTKVMLGLSGGVDSAVAACLLQQAGYEVVAAFMKNYSREVTTAGQSTECWVPEWQDAVRVAAHLNIPIVKLDFEKEYRQDVLEYFYAEYAAGRTPNPDVLCNSQIKFGAFLDAARVAGADFIATGHYARVSNVAGVHLLRSADEDKDQTYFLHQVASAALARTLFPIGHLTKSAVRALARAADLPVAEKKDSTGICFVGEVALKDFLSARAEAYPGKIITTGGEVVGTHDGLLWYTIGQRHGFGGGGSAPWYVVEKNLPRNELVVGAENDPRLFTATIRVAKARWINQPMGNLWVRTRHRQPLQAVTKIEWHSADNTELVIHTAASQRAVTPGQFAVLYNETECFGGGEIQ